MGIIELCPLLYSILKPKNERKGTMLELRNISKTYKTGEFTQVALGGVNLKFREKEFVAILGPSGSGKTTCLNIVGGLDKYDEGDLIINGKSTRGYKDIEWDDVKS